ncbi:HD domain-containing protein [Cupriavidus pauculus]|uniref:Bifunctional (P)ppGpp synthetase/guanosine-3',5'-bis(Diphosphate) 3'-pyrophosphohydrolase n=1 Tax=Cupriavidus pauculus TaxID=82633 RepID=A0A3G8H2Y2_9BURK|nr:HD domain-containing protein [Cupriavidus pauculus]AZG14913.1 bifunctional (p)ppGpp synthetase/guanosine-3',5'-bis(diphosphate) 3'-pyrophosphohydrolase [Cupriavidus pauculus]
MSIAYNAMMFARQVHKDQRRKYTNNPYLDHLAEVAGIVSSVAFSSYGDRAEEMVATAWLHDCVEDQSVTPDHLTEAFGEFVSRGVMFLSDLEQGNRAERKAASRARLAAAPGWVQTVKCADLISNTSSIVMHDPEFAKLYLEEKRPLLDVLTQADPRLVAIARAQACA